MGVAGSEHQAIHQRFLLHAATLQIKDQIKANIMSRLVILKCLVIKQYNKDTVMNRFFFLMNCDVVISLTPAQTRRVT